MGSGGRPYPRSEVSDMRPMDGERPDACDRPDDCMRPDDDAMLEERPADCERPDGERPDGDMPVEESPPSPMLMPMLALVDRYPSPR